VRQALKPTLAHGINETSVRLGSRTTFAIDHY